MRFSSTAEFRKLKACPSAETLVLHVQGGLACEQSGRVAKHLMACDFCGAAAQLLTKFPPRGEETYVRVEMPSALRRLVEDVLRSATPGGAPLAEAAAVAEPLLATDA